MPLRYGALPSEIDRWLQHRPRCTCSYCRMRGAVAVSADVGGITFDAGEEALTVYRFNTGVAQHYFCSRCGIYTHHRRRSNPNQYGVRAGFYSTASLRRTLAELVDFSIINKQSPRLTVGAANVRTSVMHYFDSRACEIVAEHIMASGALPPAFPAVCIEGEYYWDGGILSNTPTEVIFDDNPRHNSLIFAVHLWNPTGPEPRSIWEVLNRQKDIQYSSRIASHITRQQQTHRLRHVVSQLVRYLPDDVRKSEAVRELAGYGCVTQMHVVRLLAPRLANENHTKDIDFTPSGIRMRRDAGYEATMRALAQAPWQGEFDPIEGVILHESIPDLAMAAE